MIPTTISERLMFTTVRLVASNGDSGTGFFYNFVVNNIVIPTIITNKHVVRNNPVEPMKFFLHLKDGEGSNENIEITYTTDWIFHSNKDLCFCIVTQVFDYVKQVTGKEVFYMPLDDSVLATSEVLEELSALEELVMVGYPIGLWDERNNFPIFRKGYTAAHPAIDFNEDGIGLVDMACFPGSSGSPIFILNEGTYNDKRGNLIIGNRRVIFLGILYAGPTYNVTGDVVVQTIPTTQTRVEACTSIMANLGCYIKSMELLEFWEYINKNINIK